MKKILLFLLLMTSVIALWYSSLLYMLNNFGTPTDINSFNGMFGGINSLYSGLALAAIIFAVYLLIDDVKTNKDNIEKMIKTNNMHLEIIALSTLIHECDTTLHRYDRWEEAGIKGDYMNAKTSVRNKMNTYRDSLNIKYEEIQDVHLEPK